MTDLKNLKSSVSLRQYSLFDQCILVADTGLRTLLGLARHERQTPAHLYSEPQLSNTDRKLSAALLRVDHAGEVCAQALYQGQALTARDKMIRARLQHAAVEENDHLAWCHERLQTLDSHTSYLNSLWYLGALLIGLTAGLAGDRWSLGFLAETERQVVQHLQKQLAVVPSADDKTRAILEQMIVDEGKHETLAIATGARELPRFIQQLMAYSAKIMTTISYWI